MLIDYLIIGQGISGTWLSYYLQKEGKRFLLIDHNAPASSSRIAAGIINPVTGRRHVTAWMAEEILPFARDSYDTIGLELGTPVISQTNMINFFPSPQMRQSFFQRIEQGGDYVHELPEQKDFNHYFNVDFGCGQISPVFTVHLDSLLPAWRRHLIDRQLLVEEYFSIDELQIENNCIRYKDIVAGKIIFCNGYSAADSPYFKLLPFAPNKGEALIAEIPGLPADHIYKKGMMMAPLSAPGQWWIGSGYAWNFSHPDPTREFRERTEKFLLGWLKLPFTIKAHLSGIRPATLERRPFVGLHPLYPKIGILNGMGTKGCSLAPFFARQFVRHLCHNEPITPGADIKRFSTILLRK